MLLSPAMNRILPLTLPAGKHTHAHTHKSTSPPQNYLSSRKDKNVFLPSNRGASSKPPAPRWPSLVLAGSVRVSCLRSRLQLRRSSLQPHFPRCPPPLPFHHCCFSALQCRSLVGCVAFGHPNYEKVRTTTGTRTKGSQPCT